MLAYEHSDPNSRHVEAVEEGLNVVVNLHPLALTLVFENALSCARTGVAVSEERVKQARRDEGEKKKSRRCACLSKSIHFKSGSD